MSPSFNCLITLSAASPMQSSAKDTVWLTAAAIASAIGRKDISSTRCPLGLPKWLMQTTRAPLSRRSLIVVRDRSIRVASVTFPFRTGTL